jgi:2-hydroxychromene-2-carboxylate isomerase
MSPIEFWFDFSSGYAFFAAQEIDALAARVGRKAMWRPYLLGTAYKVTGSRGLSATPLKRDYSRRDWARLARRMGVEFRLPADHPRVSLPATRAFYWIDARQPEIAPAFARRIFALSYSEGLDTGSAEAVATLAPEFGFRSDEMLMGLADPGLKDRVKRIGEEAVARGVFGSPFFVVDDEPFWGWDRMTMLEDWIRQGGW